MEIRLYTNTSSQRYSHIFVKFSAIQLSFPKKNRKLHFPQRNVKLLFWDFLWLNRKLRNLRNSSFGLSQTPPPRQVLTTLCRLDGFHELRCVERLRKSFQDQFTDQQEGLETTWPPTHKKKLSKPWGPINRMVFSSLISGNLNLGCAGMRKKCLLISGDWMSLDDEAIHWDVEGFHVQFSRIFHKLFHGNTKHEQFQSRYAHEGFLWRN